MPLSALDDFLRGKGDFVPGRPGPSAFVRLGGWIAAGGFLYGAAMGSFSGLESGRYAQLLISGIKVPLLLLATYALCVPTYFALSSALGLRAGLSRALFAMAAMQAGLAVVLACFVPVTLWVYVWLGDYSAAVFYNGVVFAVASATSQLLFIRHFGPLIRQDPRHGRMVWAWLALYVFVGIQAAWVLRPFVGNPGLPVAFFRSGAWGNAYVALAKLIGQVLGGLG